MPGLFGVGSGWPLSISAMICAKSRFSDNPFSCLPEDTSSLYTEFDNRLEVRVSSPCVHGAGKDRHVDYEISCQVSVYSDLH